MAPSSQKPLSSSFLHSFPGIICTASSPPEPDSPSSQSAQPAAPNSVSSPSDPCPRAQYLFVGSLFCYLPENIFSFHSIPLLPPHSHPDPAAATHCLPAPRFRNPCSFPGHPTGFWNTTPDPTGFPSISQLAWCLHSSPSCAPRR